MRTYDDRPRSRFWNILPAKVAGLFSVQSTPGWTEKVWINAPMVPKPAIIREDFNEGTARFDGTDDDAEAQAQREDFAAFSRHYVPETTLLGRRETPGEVRKKLDGYGRQSVPKTNHGTILTYGKDLGQDELVRQVIGYDLTVGQGYAFGDAAYWQYLLDLANWKISDPYYKTGVLPPAGPYPAGLDLETAMPTVTRIR